MSSFTSSKDAVFLASKTSNKLPEFINEEDEHSLCIEDQDVSNDNISTLVLHVIDGINKRGKLTSILLGSSRT